MAHVFPVSRRADAPAAVLLAAYLLAAGLALRACFLWLPETWVLPLGSHPTIAGFNHKVIAGLLVPTFVLPAAFLVELLWVGWADSSLHALLQRAPAPTLRSDIVMALVLRTRLFTVTQLVLTFGLSQWLGGSAHTMAREALGLDLSLAAWPLPLMIVAYIVIDDFFDYWRHRIEHTWLFWPIHRYHHSAEEFNIATADRAHPGNVVILVAGFLAGFFEVPAAVAAAHGLGVAIYFYLVHTRIDSDWGWFGRWILFSPAHHRAHHARELRLAQCNYGKLVLWDAVFGTRRAAVPRSAPVGIDEASYRHGWWVPVDIVRDELEFLRRGLSLLTGRGRGRGTYHRTL